MTDPAWIAAALTAAQPQALGALLRYFRDLDTAEEAFPRRPRCAPCSTGHATGRRAMRLRG